MREAVGESEDFGRAVGPWPRVTSSDRGDDLPTFAHFTILRSVGEAAVTARWLVDEAADAQDGLGEAGVRKNKDLVERGRMEDLITRDGFDLPRGHSLLAKERMADLKAESRNAGVIPRKPWA